MLCAVDLFQKRRSTSVQKLDSRLCFQWNLRCPLSLVQGERNASHRNSRLFVQKGLGGIN